MKAQFIAKKNQIKTHFAEHKQLYFGIAIGAGSMAVLGAKAYQINIQSPGAMNVFVEAPKRNMHPGYLVQDVETKRCWPSIRSAAKDLGVNEYELRKHVKGLNEDVGGHTLEVLGEATA